MIIADENIFRGLIAALRNEGYDVVSIFETYRGMLDIDIASFSLNPPRIIITEDKDFGKLIYEDNIKVIGIIFLRFLDTERNGIIEKVISLLQNENLETLSSKFITITSKKIRVNDI